MSIYASTFTIGDEHKPRCARIKRVRKGVYEQDDNKRCTCKACPLIYHGSHVVPSDKAERGGSLDLAAIPGHIDGQGLKAISDDMQPYHPWLRVGTLDGITLNYNTVLLDKKQVERLRDELTTWLKLTEV